MISKGLFYYVAMIGFAVAITFFYIQPAFSDITEMQDDIAVYKLEREKVDAVNSQLNTLVNRLESVSVSDQQRLLTYIPNEVDPIAVSRTLQNIAAQTEVLFVDVGYGEVDDSYMSEAEANNLTDYPVPHRFNFSVQGTYEQIKTLLRLLESNNYPLEVHELVISTVVGNFLNAEITVVTYSHTQPTESTF